MSNDKKFFPQGLFFNEPRQGAPDFVKGSVNIKVADFKEYLGKVKGEYLNIDLKVSKDGKAYAEVNTFKPDKSKGNAGKQAYSEPEPESDTDDDLPF